MPNVTVFLEKENKTRKINANSIEDIMNVLKINPETVLIARNNELVTKNAKIRDKDNIKFLSVVSGG